MGGGRASTAVRKRVAAAINARSAVGCYYHNVNSQFTTGEVAQVLLFDGTQPVVTTAVLLTVSLVAGT